MPAAKFIVAGKVQSVFYRASAREQARKFGLTGYAKNLSDGRVEVLASGATSSLDALEQWLRVGPPAARVDTVDRENLDGETSSGDDAGFQIR